MLMHSAIALQRYSTVMVRHMRVIAAALTICLASAAFAESAHLNALSTREIYNVSLERTLGYLFTARGRTVVDTRVGCGTTHTLQRSLADVTYKDGEPIRTDFTIETWESADGRTLRFRVRNEQSGNGTEAHDGVAKLTADGSGQVTFRTRDKPFALPRGTMFPSAFARAMLEAAKNGRDLESHLVFQGGGQNALVTAAVRIGHTQSKPHEKPKVRATLLNDGAVWPILISYFEKNGEQPSSEIAADLYGNGLLGSFSLVYPQFTLQAKLVRVERLPSSC
jgi:hypothetical protein